MSTTEPNWQPIAKLPTSVPLHIRDWLTAEVSLTARLRLLGTFTVRVLQERWGLGETTECQMLNVDSHTELWQRDVALLVDDQPVVIAHTLIPPATLEAVPELYNLRTQSLGDLVFKDLQGSRECLEFAQVSEQHNLFKLTFLSPQQSFLWARRSVLKARTHCLLVNELFMGS